MLNGGVPALELIDNNKLIEEEAKEAHDNAGVIILGNQSDPAVPTSHPGMLENYKERMADVIAMLDK